MKKLDAREKLFVAEYLIDLKAERAAVAAGYTKTVAKAKSYDWVGNSRRKPHVFNAVQKAMDKRAAKLELTADRVLRELSLMGYANMLDYIQVDNGDVFLDLSKLTREQAAAIQEITFDEYVERGTNKGNGNGRQVKRIRIKLADKIRSLELLGKHLKLFTEVHHHTGSISLSERMKRAEERNH